MSNRRMQKAERAEFWRAMMEAYKSSGMTVAVFCQQEGLTTSSYYLWRKQLARMDADLSPGEKAKPAVPSGRARFARQRKDNDPIGFVEVASLNSNADRLSGLTISFPGDISIAAAPGCDLDLLRQAVMILSERSC